MLPKFSRSYLVLLTELAGRTFPRFSAEKSITGGGAEDDIGFGDSAIVTVPSGPYFLGLPLFFFAGILAAAAGAVVADGAAVVAGAAGGAGETGGGVVDPPVWAGFSDLGATW